MAEAEAKANQLLDQLKKGAKFDDLAKKSSDGPTAAQGGTLGTFKRGELAKDLEEKTFSLKAGENTGVIRTRQGFIILKVTAHRAAGIPPLKDISDRIREAIYSERLEPAARAYLTKLREQAFIDIKSGYTDTGASPNQSNKPTIVAAKRRRGNRPGKAQEKEKIPGVLRERLLRERVLRDPPAGFCLVSSCKRVSVFLALFGKLLFSFFGLKQYVVRIAQVLFPALSRFSVTAPVVKLKLVQVFEKFLVKFGLQFKSKTREQLCQLLI